MSDYKKLADGLGGYLEAIGKNFSDADAHDVIKYLHTQGFSNTEVEEAFAGAGIELDMDRYITASQKEDERTQMVAAIVQRIKKKMSPEMRMELATILLPYYEKATHKPSADKKSKKSTSDSESDKGEEPPTVRPYKDGEWSINISERIKQADSVHFFESKSNLYENIIGTGSVGRIFKYAHKNNLVLASPKEMMKTWESEYGSSSVISDLNTLLKQYGAKSSKTASKIIKKLNISKIKERDVAYVQNISAIVLEYDLLIPVTEYLLKNGYDPRDTSLSENISGKQVMKVFKEITDEDNITPQQANTQDSNSVAHWIKEWVRRIPRLRGVPDSEKHINNAVNNLSKLYRKPMWGEVRAIVIKGFSQINAPQNQLQNAIRRIDTGQPASTMSESMAKKIIAEILLIEKRLYGENNS